VRGVRLFTLIAVLALLALPAAASAKVPQNFVGMMADGPVFAKGVSLNGQLDKMVSSGVQSVRVAFSWAVAQPYASWKDVPADRVSHFSPGPHGVPTAFFNTDIIVAQAAKHRLALLPVVTYAPSWDASSKGNHRQPARDKPYGWYLTALVQRYGPKGTFWTSHPGIPRRPITRWEIWNEPDLTTNWNTTPFAPSYVSLLRVASRAIRQADPSATVVLAALTNFGWKDLEAIYKVHGARQLFDVAAANPYTKQPSGVITILGYFRKVMKQYGDAHKPLLATEVGWPSGKGKANANFGINTTERGQAKKLSQLLPLLVQNRHQLGLRGFYYYTWMTPDPRHAGPFYYAGLLHYEVSKHRIKPKPAYWAFRRTVLGLER
jgi:hypothetical protein